MKQRQQHVTKPIIHEKGPMYLSVVQRPPGAPPGGGMALNEAGGTPPGWYGAAYGADDLHAIDATSAPPD